MFRGDNRIECHGQRAVEDSGAPPAGGSKGRGSHLETEFGEDLHPRVEGEDFLGGEGMGSFEGGGGQETPCQVGVGSVGIGKRA